VGPISSLFKPPLRTATPGEGWVIRYKSCWDIYPVERRGGGGGLNSKGWRRRGITSKMGEGERLYERWEKEGANQWEVRKTRGSARTRYWKFSGRHR
jgi:hypothetical protein